MCCKCCSDTQKKIWVFGGGAFIGLFALILGLLWPAWSIQLLDSKLVLKNGSMSYNNWIKTPIPMYLEIYFFDWMNPNDVNDANIKPKVVERGPYVFIEKHERVNITWNNNGTITYNQIRTWHFVEERSNGTLNDTITFASVIPATVAFAVRNSFIESEFADLFLVKDAKIYNTKSVKEVLFDGFDDPVLDRLKKFPKVKIPFEKFGWFVDRNGSATYDGQFNMYTGENNIFNMGKLLLWNGKPRTGYYRDKCGVVHGTSGELWPPGMQATDTKTIFSNDICRTITLQYKEDDTVMGITGSKYIADDRVFDNGIKYPENLCYCAGKNQSCPDVYAGVMNISDCRFGAPIFVSYPHFYLADERYVDAIDGMRPKRENHEFTLSLETKTGIPLNANARLQINLHLAKNSGISLYKKLPHDIMMPMIWFRQTTTLTEDLANRAKIAINLTKIGIYTAYSMAAIGAIFVIVGLLTLTNLKSKLKFMNRENNNYAVLSD